MKIKTKRMEYGFIALQVGGNTLQGLWKKNSCYMSDTFTNYYSTITQAKTHTIKLAKEGYFGKAIQQLTNSEENKNEINN